MPTTQEAVIFQRRNRLKKHFVNVSNVLLYYYQNVSDAAKITFQIIDGFDWESKDTGDSKGFVFPAVKTLSKIRNTSERTIRRHLVELIGAKLLTRVRRKYKASILYIEEVSEEEITKYFAYFEAKKGQTFQQNSDDNFRTDKNVHSLKALERTKMSVVYKKEKESLKENEINVNENFNKKRVGNGMISLQGIMKHYDIDKHSQSKNKAIPVKTIPENRAQRDYHAQEIADVLQDQKSLGCFRVIAEKIPSGVIFETLASIKETWREGRIKQSRGALFVNIMKTYAQSRGIELGFA